jgi:hypothetical protein
MKRRLIACAVFLFAGCSGSSSQATPVRDAPSPARPSACVELNDHQDSRCTPGATDPRVIDSNIDSTICVSGYSRRVRPSTSVTNAIKRERMRAYGLSGSPSQYELDHLIPIALGGAPSDVRNLWPEPWSAATVKDRLENRLHSLVCTHRMTLSEAQREVTAQR